MRLHHTAGLPHHLPQPSAELQSSNLCQINYRLTAVDSALSCLVKWLQMSRSFLPCFHRAKVTGGRR